ncbi:MAG: hypothetical protein JXR76_20745 [Deltaproteobacteria bacterium]|nr:hypothetical protein [Deltaproteobacteria bacterium]
MPITCADNPCGANATCVMGATPEEYECICNAGYERDGLACTDIDSCATASCFPLSTCEDFAAPAVGYECICPPGFTGDGHSCYANECVVYVSPLGDDAANGGGWDSALRNIYTAIDRAKAIRDEFAEVTSCEVWVAGGTYHPRPNGPILVYSGVNMYGGFAGTELARDDRDFDVNETIISAEFDDGRVAGRILQASGSPILDGFTIDGADGSASGAGFYVGNASPRIEHCHFKNNYTEDVGGAIYVRGGKPIIVRSQFTDNGAFDSIPTDDDNGGAIGADYGSEVYIINSVFTSNAAANDGGALFANSSNASIKVINSIFDDNYASQGGALAASFDGVVGAYNCNFYSNEAKEYQNGASWDDIGSLAYGGIEGVVSVRNSYYEDQHRAVFLAFDTNPEYAGAVGTSNCLHDEDDAFDPWPNMPYRLGTGSPLRDAGNKNYLFGDPADLDGDGDLAEDVPLDFYGGQRVINGQVDVGIAEWGNRYDSYCDGCVIGWACYSNGDINPANGCQICDSAVSISSWHNRDGEACGEGMACAMTTCLDVDECETGTHNCHINANCNNTVGSFSCECKIGYDGDGVSFCDDIDECDLQENPCNDGDDVLATCENTVGSVDCDCSDGFEQIFNTCIDINECNVDNGGCDLLAGCENTVGSFHCNDCPEGYDGTGATGCFDINECDPVDPCGVNATCDNTPGAYVCNCDDGFFGDGFAGCSDVDECEWKNGYCDPVAVCNNVPGGHTCGDCPAGYTGDGYTGCQDIDECVSGTACGANAHCENSPGSVSCECNAGYEGDGTVGCTEINECLVDNGGCDALTQCTDGLAEVSCGPCPAGYTGNGQDGCVDIDECAVDNGGCDMLTRCENTDGGFSCGECPTGWDGDGESGCIDFNSEVGCITYVNSIIGNDANDGESWLYPKKTINAALDAALSLLQWTSCDAAEVWVTMGTYKGSGGRALPTVDSKKGGWKTYIYGGFNGRETARSQRDIALYPSVISGELGDPDDPTDNACHVVSFYHDGPVIDGFTIRDGYAVGCGGTSGGNKGGGVMYGKTVNCIIENNVAERGGGAYNVRMHNTIVRNNRSLEDGGGMYAGTATYATFSGNRAGTNGGGTSDVDVYSSTIDNNYAAGNGGGVFLSEGAYSKGVRYSKIINNRVPDDDSRTKGMGGGMYFQRPTWYSSTHGTVRNTLFDGNTANRGGGMYDGAAVDSVFVNNIVPDNYKYGYGGGTYDVLVENSIFENNSAWGGGAMALGEASGSEFIGNHASNFGGAVFQTDVTTSRFISNTSDADGGAGYDCSFDECYFESNSAQRGGAVFDCVGKNSQLIQNTAKEGGASFGGGVHDSYFTQNTATVRGGASCQSGHARSTFEGNSAPDGGAVANSSSVRDCLIVNNNAGKSGGGLYNSRPISSVIIGNTAVQNGGGMSGGTAQQSYFTANEAANGAGMSGGTSDRSVYFANRAIQSGGGVYETNATGSIMVGNLAQTGGGFAGNGTRRKLINSTVVSNNASVQGSNVYDAEGFNNIAPLFTADTNVAFDYSVTALQTLSTELNGYPLGKRGTIVAVNYDANTYQTALTVSKTPYADGELKGMFIWPENINGWQFAVADNTADTIWVYGDLRTDLFGTVLAEAGDAYELYDLRLKLGSSLIDAGNAVGAPLYDINEVFRTDNPDCANTGVGDGARWVDIGAFESGDGSGPVCDAPVMIGSVPYLVCNERMTRADASDYCKNFGYSSPYLPYILSSTINSYLNALYTGRIWINALEGEQEGDWAWEQPNVPWGNYLNWDLGYPHIDFDTKCAVAVHNDTLNGVWRDANCENKEYFICVLK